MDTQSTYDRFGKAYHEKRLREVDSVYNRYLDDPIFDRLLDTDLSGQQVLDLGCGSGFLAQKLLKRGGSIQGIDFSDTLIEIAKQESPGVEFRRGNLNNLPFPDLSFDLIVSALVFHYEQDLLPGFMEARRAIRPKGKFVFTIHHPIQEVMEKDGDPSGRRLLPYFHNQAYDWEMLESMELRSYHHTFEAISDSLYRAGFAIERIVEPRAPASLQSTYPGFYQDTRDFPSFCGFKTIPI